MSDSLQFPTRSYLQRDGVLSPLCKHNIDPKILMKGYRIMNVARLVDDRMITLQRQGIISFALSALGEEACAVASAAALEPNDWLYPQYREAGITFWRGFTIEQYIHQMFGDARDLIRGRQLPNHFGSRVLNIVQVSSPIATQILHAAGCAYAMKLQDEPTVALCYFGEGATSEGDFHAGLNFAAVRQAPVIFFCRNNGYAISTPCSRQFASDGIAPKGIGYGIKAVRIDGNDFFAIHEAVAEAREHCIAGKGPVLIEAMTFRMGAHSTSDDPTVYRSNAETEKWEQSCPIKRLRLFLERSGMWDAHQEKELLKYIGEEITQSIKIAKATPLPLLHTIVEDVYFQVPQTLEEQYRAIIPYQEPSCLN